MNTKITHRHYFQKKYIYIRVNKKIYFLLRLSIISNMSDSGPSLVESIVKKASETVANIFANTDTLNANLTNGTNETEKFKATPEGLFLAYSSLVVMALIPIVVGSFKSVKHQTNQKESGEEIETMSTREAALFPVIASVTLFGIYLVFQV